MIFLLKHIRKILYSFSFLLSVGIYYFNVLSVADRREAVVQTLDAYALCALGFLYLVLLCSPLYGAFPKLPYRAVYVKAKRGLGLSAFYFATLHALLAFFYYLGGFGALKYLDNVILLALFFSTSALVILTVQAVTSNNFAVIKLGKFWEKLHRFVYLAAVLIVLHLFLIKPEVRDISDPANLVLWVLLVFMLILQTKRFRKFLRAKKSAS